MRRATYNSLTSITVSNQISFEVSGLEMFTNYEFRVAGKNKRGVGLDSQPIIVNTDQGSELILIIIDQIKGFKEGLGQGMQLQLDVLTLV
jgi:hypothetical protein